MVIGFFSFVTLNILCHFLLSCKVSAEKSAYCHRRVPLYISSCFPFVAFNILSMSLIFAILIIVCVGVDQFGFVLLRTLCLLDLNFVFPFPV